ncbi:acyl-CoA-binding protein [Chitinimonas lacunae]|uniref:Acyl-CoA-binding protein n=1 Tax=Chitinimonas lacunae TaxID=1963018 RepID=A0ABV8MSA7_9NEIS
MSDIAARFKQAAEDVTKLSEAPDNQVKLKLYALYKQASEGDVQGDRPGMMDFVGRAKYDAWDGLKGLSNEEAMQKYIDLVEALKAKE